MTEQNQCNQCGTPVPGKLSGRLCPRCCIDLALRVDGLTLQVTEADLWDPGRVALELPGYELFEKIGEGGMGLVFKARQLRLNRVVAVKMLRSGSLATAAEIGRFRVEAQTAARLQHPNIVAIHEVGESNGHLFFSMAYIPGKSLSQVTGRTPLAPARAARYVSVIARAIDYAHGQGVLHRDLKPANVLVDEGDQLRITDFGIAKTTDTPGEMTATGHILGTPSYMSPEQAGARRGAIGPATDIYSIGAILYDLLTARPPFRADSPAETIRQVIESEPAPPRLMNPGIDRDLETICLKCLSKDPEKRYATAGDLADDLDRYLKREPIRARRIGNLARLHRWALRHPSLAALAAVFVLMFLFIAYFSHADAVDGVSAAWADAQAIRWQLFQLEKRVVAVATNLEPALFGMTIPVATGQTSPDNPLYLKLKVLFETFAFDTPGTAALFENFLLITPAGDVIANYNPRVARELPNVSARHYFQGATNLAFRDRFSPVHISKPYKSVSDTTYKLGLSVPLRDSAGHLEAVFAAMIGTASTEAPTGLRTDRIKSALVAELDPSRLDTPEQPQLVCPHAVFWHPSYEKGRSTLVPISHPHVIDLLSSDSEDPRILTDESYQDPVLSAGGLFEPHWVAGFSRVPRTPLVVIHQVRDRAFEVFILGSVLAVLLSVVALVARLRARWLIKRSNGSTRHG